MFFCRKYLLNFLYSLKIKVRFQTHGIVNPKTLSINKADLQRPRKPEH